MAKRNKNDLLKHRAALEKRIGHNSTDIQPRFLAFSHPDNLFHIDYPGHWKIEHEKEAPYSTNIFPKDREGVYITIFRMPFQHDMKAITDNDRFEEGITKMLELVGGVDSRPDPTVAYPCMTCDKPEPGEAGQRWIVAHGDSMICLSTGIPEEEEHIYRPLFERMLSSFRIKREAETLFVKLHSYVLEELQRRTPEVTWEPDGDGGALKTDRLKLSLGNLFASVQNTPNNLESLADEFVAGVVSMVNQTESLGHETLPSVRDAIVPLLKPESYLQMVAEQHASDERATESAEASELAELVSTPWLTDLHVCYAIDLGQTFRLVNQRDAEQWGIDAESLHELAIKNLVEITEPEFETLPFPNGKGGIAMLKPVAGAASAYVLHPGLYAMIQPDLGNDLLVAIPERDSLLIFGDQSDQKQGLAERVRQDHARSAHALSDRLFRLTPDGMCLV